MWQILSAAAERRIVMKKKLVTRVTAMLLLVITAVSLLPINAFAYDSNSNMEYIDGGYAEKELYEHLGYGFNALSDTVIKDTTLKNSAGVVINYDAVKAGLLSTSYSEADVKYAKTAEELMLSFGIDYTDQSSVGIPLENAKVGFASKFGFSADMKNRSITESLYYYYREEILTGKYSLILPAQLLDDPSQIISDDFIYALEKLNSDYSDEKCADFFNKWGTHILVSYNKGAALEYVAVGHSIGKEFSANAEITNELSASAGIGSLKAESTQTLAAKLGVAYSGSEYNLTHKWFGMGGDSNLIGANGADAATISAAGIESWKATVSQEKSVLIPQSTEWISVWELIPDTYAGAKNALQAYYKTQATGINASFFSKFTTYSQVCGATDIYYTSPAGYVTKIAYYSDGSTKVAPGSRFNVVDPDADLSNIVFPASDNYTVDEYGTVTMKATSGKVKVLVTDLEGNEITGASKTFTVVSEGAGLYAGGYGDAERPYLISNATEFTNIRNYPGKNFILISDIDLRTISPIDSFSGRLDGNGYTLSNFGYAETIVGNVGLFRTNNGIIKNLTISGFWISRDDTGVEGESKLGLLCGINYNTIENVIVYAGSVEVKLSRIKGVEATNAIYCGAVCGYNASTGKISKCVTKNCTLKCEVNSAVSQGSPRAKSYVGGIAGLSEGGSISNVAFEDSYIYSYAYGGHYGLFTHYVAIPKSYAGGIVGYAKNTSISYALGYSTMLENCIIAEAELEGTCATDHGQEDYSGAIIGLNEGSTYSYGYCMNSNGLPLVGSDSSTVNTAYHKDSLITAGAIHSLTGFSANGWAQSSSGGHPYIAKYTSLEIKVGKTKYFTGEPLNLKGLVIEAVSENVNCQRLTVNGGFTVSGYDPNKTGTQTVTVKYGKISGTYNVTVSDPQLSGIVISSKPYKTAYFKPFARTSFPGEKLDLNGLSVIAKYTDGTSAEIPYDSLSLPASAIVTESRNITVSYKGFEAVYKVEAFDVLPSKIEAVENSCKTNYAPGDDFDPNGLQVKLTYNNGDTETLGLDSLTVDPAEFNADIADTYSIKVKYEGVETSYNVTVGSVKSISIATAPDKLSYYSSEKELDSRGLSLNVTYDNGASKVVCDGFTLSGYNSGNVGKQDITVTYGGASATFKITVLAVEMSSVEVFEYPKTTYYAGNTFTSSGLKLKVNYNDSSSKEISSGFTVKLEGHDENTYPVLNTLGKKNVSVSYTENGIIKTTEYEIEILKDFITELQVIRDPNKTTYNLWDEFSYSGMAVNSVYASGKTEAVELDETMFSVQKFTEAGTQTVTLNYNGRSATLTCTVNAPSSVSVSRLPAKTEYVIGETVSSEGIEVKAHFNDGSSKTVDNALLSFSYPSTETIGNKTVKVSLGDLEAEFEITVKKQTVDENAPQIVVSDKTASAGNTVTVTVDLLNNPGFSGLNVYLTYSDCLTLVEATSSIDLTFTNDRTMVWDGISDYTEDGELLKLVFKISDTAELGDYFVRVNFVEAYTADLDDVSFATVDGYIKVIDFVYGDANGDGTVNTKDIILVRRHVAAKDPMTGLSSVEVSAGADANGDGTVNTKDIILVRRHVAAKDPVTGESSVVLGPNT